MVSCSARAASSSPSEPGELRAQPLDRRPAVALLLGLADAQHGIEAGRERRGHLARERLVGLAEQRAPLGVAEQHPARTRIGEHARRDLARERALLGLVHRLAPDTDADRAEHVRDHVDRGEGRTDGDIDGVEVADRLCDLSRVVERLPARLVHLPVACDQRRFARPSRLSFRGQGGDAGERAALEQLEARAATR